MCNIEGNHQCSLCVIDGLANRVYDVGQDIVEGGEPHVTLLDVQTVQLRLGAHTCRPAILRLGLVGGRIPADDYITRGMLPLSGSMM